MRRSALIRGLLQDVCLEQTLEESAFVAGARCFQLPVRKLFGSSLHLGSVLPQNLLKLIRLLIYVRLDAHKSHYYGGNHFSSVPNVMEAEPPRDFCPPGCTHFLHCSQGACCCDNHDALRMRGGQYKNTAPASDQSLCGPLGFTEKVRGNSTYQSTAEGQCRPVLGQLRKPVHLLFRLQCTRQCVELCFHSSDG